MGRLKFFGCLCARLFLGETICSHNGTHEKTKQIKIKLQTLKNESFGHGFFFGSIFFCLATGFFTQRWSVTWNRTSPGFFYSPACFFGGDRDWSDPLSAEVDVHWYKVHCIDTVQVTEMLFLDLQGEGRRGRFPPAFISYIFVRCRRRHVAAAAAEKQKAQLWWFQVCLFFRLFLFHICMYLLYCTYIWEGVENNWLLRILFPLVLWFNDCLLLDFFGGGGGWGDGYSKPRKKMFRYIK